MSSHHEENEHQVYVREYEAILEKIDSAKSDLVLWIDRAAQARGIIEAMKKVPDALRYHVNSDDRELKAYHTALTRVEEELMKLDKL